MQQRITTDTAGGTPDEEPTARLARVLRTAREQRGWNQEELAANAGVSRPTIQRWENGKTGTPDPVSLRRVFGALGLDARLIPVVLGYVTQEEMNLPATDPQVLTPTEEEALRILKDPTVPAAAKEAWLRFLKFQAREAVEGRPERPRAS